MTTAATSLLGLALPVTGELSGTWGDTVNNSITSLLDTAVAGTTTLSTDADVTLTTTTLASNQARQAILLWTANGTTTRNITAPAQSKIYTVINASAGTQSIVLRGAGPTTGVTIVKGESAICAWNGSDFIKVSNASGAGTFTNLTVTGNTVLGDADTDTLTFGASFVTGTTLKTAKSDTNTLALAAYDVDGTAYTNLITLTASNTPTLALTSTGVGTINNMSIGATTASTGAFTTLSASSTVTLSGGTANGVAYLNGSKVVTTGSALTFDGTNLGINTGSPGAPLDVNGTVGIIRNTATTGTNQVYTRQGNTGGYFYTGLDTSAGGFLTGSAYAGFLWMTGAYPMVFGTSNAEQMRLTSTGLGIGTSSPFGKLAVSNGGASGFEFFTNYIGGGLGTYIQSYNRSTSAYMDTAYNAATHAFYTSGSERMRLDSSGNLGLGVTPSAWTTFKVMQLGNFGAIGAVNSTSMNMFANTFYDGAFKYINTAAATRYRMDDGHSWYVAPSGTAGNAITFTQAMTLDASGNLGIGTTSPGGYTLALGDGSSNRGRIYIKGATGGNYPEINIDDTMNTSGRRWQIYSTGGAYILGDTTGGERMRIDSSGNVGIGTSSPAYKLDVSNTSAGAYVVSRVNNLSATGYTRLLFEIGTNGANGSADISYVPGTFFAVGPSSNDTTTPIVFRNNNATERARIDSSGNLLVGTTSTSIISGWSMSANAIIGNGNFSGGGGMGVNSTSSTGTQYFIGFGRGGSNCGSITSTTTNSTSYLTSSDYRLKENVQPMTGALAKVAALKPCTYTWKEDGTSGQGFIAHELQAIVPEAVSGEKDAIDVEGNPRYQGVDTSFLVATLTAAIQELKSELDTVKAELATLKGN